MSSCLFIIFSNETASSSSYLALLAITLWQAMERGNDDDSTDRDDDDEGS